MGSIVMRTTCWNSNGAHDNPVLSHEVHVNSTIRMRTWCEPLDFFLLCNPRIEIVYIKAKYSCFAAKSLFEYLIQLPYKCFSQSGFIHCIQCKPYHHVEMLLRLPQASKSLSNLSKIYSILIFTVQLLPSSPVDFLPYNILLGQLGIILILICPGAFMSRH